MVVSHILIPYDGEEHSERAFYDGLRIAKKYGARISVLTCFGGQYFRVGVMDLIMNGKNLPEKIQKLKDKATLDNVSMSYHPIQDDAIVANIQSFALKNNVDMIIMGSNNHKGFKKTLHGSITEKVNQHAHCVVKLVS